MGDNEIEIPFRILMPVLNTDGELVITTEAEDQIEIDLHKVVTETIAMYLDTNINAQSDLHDIADILEAHATAIRASANAESEV